MLNDERKVSGAEARRSRKRFDRWGSTPESQMDQREPKPDPCSVT